MSKRFSLRDFQQQVLDRLQVQKSGVAKTSSLGVLIGSENWLVDMKDISEVIPVPAMTPVPLTKSWYCGVANVRGNLHGIIDLDGFMNSARTQMESSSRVMLLGHAYSFNCGLLVARVLGLHNIEAWQQSETNGEVRYQDNTGRVWRKLDITQIVQQPEFLQIGA